MPPDPPDRKLYKYMKAGTAKNVLEKAVSDSCFFRSSKKNSKRRDSRAPS